MSTTSAGEEIEELRAKAIASMASAANPSIALRSKSPKSPKSREEGEISPAEDAVLPACSSAILNDTVVEEHLPSVAMDNLARAKQDCSTVKSLPSSSATMGNAQTRSSVTQKYSKQFRTVPGSLKSTSNQSLSWHGKGSGDNLVISFSDDDSGSDSEESKLEKRTSTKDDVSRVNRSEVPVPSAPSLLRGLQGGTDGTNPGVKKALAHAASIPFDTRSQLTGSRHLAISSKKNTHIPRHNSRAKISARQDDRLVSDPNVANRRLANLRHEIALRENELKTQSKLVPQSNEKNAGPYVDNYGPHKVLVGNRAATVRRPAAVAGIELAPKEKIMKRLKPDVGLSSTGQLQLPISSSKSAQQCSSQLVENSGAHRIGDPLDSYNDKNEKREHIADIVTPVLSGVLPKMKDTGLLVPGHVAMSTSAVSSKDKNDGNLAAIVFDSSDKLEQRNMRVDRSVVVSQMRQSDANIKEGALNEIHMSLHKNLHDKCARRSDVSRAVDSSSLLPDKAPGEHSVMRTQQIVATTGAQTPLETLSHFPERPSGQVAESNSGDDQAPRQNANLLNYSTRLNILGEARMNLQSLVELEDLQDKELEEAQELRRRCELEERHALKAYRKAQRSLVDANEKCSLLYRKRELFSAQLRALLMQASSSMWPSSWQSLGGTLSESIETVPDASFDLLSGLGPQLPVDCRILHQLNHESNSRRAIDAQPGASSQQLNADGLVSAQCLEQDASTSDHRYHNALDGVPTPVNRPDVSTDDEENYPLECGRVEDKLTWNVMEENHGQPTADIDGPEKSPYDENAQDYEQLEACLRSKLVKRFGSRKLYKDDKLGEIECHAQSGADKNGGATKSPSGDLQMEEGQQIESLEREESCQPSQTSDSTLPSSVLHAAFGHAKFALLGCFGQLFTTRENEVVMYEEFNECMPACESAGLHSVGFSRISEMEFHSYDSAVDPFWPFCLFDLRGKCNDEECPLQHVKNSTLRKLKHDEHSATSSSDQASQLSSVRKHDYASGSPYGLFCHSLTMPTYYIGLNLIKVDSHLSFSMLARNMWQYWQKGFCATFSLPFCVRRILPPDAPFLQTGDATVADDYSWNRLSLYHQTLDGSMNQFVHGLPESEHSLEMALDLFDGNICKPDRKKALCMLSRAIEVDPHSVALWVVYLHIYYARETTIGKDDLFFHAVKQNEGSYELWLMYINSRMQLGDRLNAYEHALTTFCGNGNALQKDKRYVSACILDIFLQMIDFLCMSGNVEKAIQEIVGLVGNSGNTLFSDMKSCLIVSDRCIFWFCCIYLAIYRKLPELIVQQFEFEKELPFGIEWPSTHLTTDRKECALGLMKLAVDEMALDIDANPLRKDQAALRSLHFLAVSHIRCVGAVEGFCCCADLLATYLRLYPTCIELVLMSARLKENCTCDAVIKGFEELLASWPKENSGIQCLWNQYVEHALAEERIDLAETILARWFEHFFKGTTLHDWNLRCRKDGSCDSFDLPSRINNDGSITSAKQDDMFLFLNLSLYKTLQKDLREAQSAIDKALKLASPQDYRHCVEEHVAFSFANEAGSATDKSLSVMLGLLNGYLADCRSSAILEPFSRKFHRYIRRPRLRQLITNLLGPVSRDFTLVNSVLAACYGTPLLPEKLDYPKEFVDVVESLMEVAPANYRLALSVYRLITNLCHPSVAGNAIKFWACSLLVNSIFQSVPVAPEYIWVEAANVLRNSEFLDISTRFHLQAISVYPFSIKLWQSYLDTCRDTDSIDVVVETARERGVELSRPTD